MEPKIGIRKLNIDIKPTLLYFKRIVQMENATDDKSAIYIRRLVDLIVKPLNVPPKTYPKRIKIIPPMDSW